MQKKTYLVVGGDSLVGKELVKSLSLRGYKVYSTTRRINQVDKNRLYLNYENIENFSTPNDIDYAFIVAGISNYKDCEQDSKSSWINIDVIPNLLISFISKKIFTSYISSNSVFGGGVPWPEEESDHAPGIAYAIQKSQAEKLIQKIASSINCSDMFNIIRITKILDIHTPPIPDWIKSWSNGHPVYPFSDLIFAPMSSKFVGDSLATLGELNVSGNLHLSGEENISYVEFATLLAERLSVDLKLIQPSDSKKSNVNIAFKPKYSGLGMSKTTKLSGIYPQNINSVISDILFKGL